MKPKYIPRKVKSAEIVSVIRTKVCIGEGTQEDLARDFYQYWSLEGELLATRDTWKEEKL